MSFERRLAAHLALLLAPLSACGGDPPPEAACDDVPSSLVREEGYVTVPAGDPCPDAPDAGVLEALDCCPVLEYTGRNCGFVRREEGGALTYSGGTTGEDPAAPAQDRCYYDGLFEPTGVCCGRPLADGDRAVVAPVAAGSAWRGGVAADVRGLGDAARAAVAAHWLAAARLEHASIASFARATLDLLRLGAPPELVADAHRAGLDEIVHARLCFAIASAAARRPLDPGPLAVPPEGPTDAAAIVLAVVREGCVGEAVAALDAARRLRDATDPGVREALAAIVADEGRHAALAWRTLAWALRGPLAGGGEALRERIDGLLRAERARLLAAEAPAGPAVPSHGVLGADAARPVVAEAFDRVIGPAWAELRGLPPLDGATGDAGG